MAMPVLAVTLPDLHRASRAAGLALALALTAATAVAQTASLPDLPLDSYSPAARAVIGPASEAARAAPRDPQAAGALAMALHAWEQWEAAHDTYARTIALAPDAFEWRYLDALVLARLSRPADAAAALRAALERNPSYLAARVKLADALFEAGDLAASRDAYRALQHEPRVEPIVAFGLGRIAAAEGRTDEAVRHFERAIALFPDFGPAHYALALAWRTLGRRDEARASLAKHQALGARWPAVDDPVQVQVTALKDDAAAHVRRGIKLAEAGDVAGAIEAHEAALVRSPSATQAHANLITLYGRAKRWEDAERHYRAVLATGLHLDEAHYSYGVVLLAQERWADAENAFRLAIEANPHNADARNNLGQLLEGERKFADAAVEYRRAVESQPGLRIARFNLGRMLIALGKPEEAVRELSQLTTPRDAETPRYLFALATATLHAGRRDEGLRIAEDARQLALEFGQDALAAAIARELGKLGKDD
ncbi:MAG TPA: tetratricopeptide repeat protein [Vicinamibacterales bacterium]